LKEKNNEIYDDVLVALHDSHVSGLGDGCLDVHLLSNSLHAVTTVTSDFPPTCLLPDKQGVTLFTKPLPYCHHHRKSLY